MNADVPMSRRDLLGAGGGFGLALLGGLFAPEEAGAQAPLRRGYRDTVLADRPVACWRLGEARGPTAFDETRRHDGRYHGGVTFHVPGAITSDRRHNRAIQLHGRGYVEIPSSAAFSQPTSRRGLSVEVWLRPDVLTFRGEGGGANPYIHWLGKGEVGQREWGFRFYSKTARDRPNRLSAYIWNPDGDEGAGAFFQDTLRPGEWIHIVATYDPGDRTTRGAGVSIYKNGRLRQGPRPGPTFSRGTLYSNPRYNIVPRHGSSPLLLGLRDRRRTVNGLVGGLDEVAIYPYVLSPRQVLAHYQAAH